MSPSGLAAAYLALSSAERAVFALEAGLTSRAHTGSRRTKNGICPETRALVYAREEYRCYWCGCDLERTGAHLDHVVRERAPGMPVYLMVVASCPSCNVTRPASAAEAARVAARLTQVCMTSAYKIRKSPAGQAAFAAVRAASGMGKPTTKAEGGF